MVESPTNVPEGFFEARKEFVTVIVLLVLFTLATSARTLPAPFLESEAIRGNVLDRLEKLPPVYFGPEYEQALVARLKDFRLKRCARFTVCRLLITPTGYANLEHPMSATAAQMLSVEGTAAVRLRLRTSQKAIPLTVGKNPHDWDVNGRRFELFGISLEAPGEEAFSFLFYSRAVPSELDGRQLLTLVERLSGTKVLDLRIRWRNDAGESGPVLNGHFHFIEAGELECGHVRVGADPYRCSVASKNDYGVH
jgi:hypothetical protein